MGRRLLRLAAFLAVAALLALPPPSDAQLGATTKFVVCAAECSAAGADCTARSSPEYCAGWMMGCMASCVAF
jgi:hypothetical protein